MTGASPLSFVCDELKAVKKNWGLFLAFGIALIVLGMLAISMPFVTGLYVAMLIGVLLMVGGVLQIMGAFQTRSWGAFFLQLLVGIIYLITGLLMVDQPDDALKVLTILVAVSLLIGGLFRVLVSLMNRFPGWGWLLATGALQIVLGLLIWRQLPESALWVVGLFVGIDLLSSGAMWVALALSIRELPLPGGAASAAPAPTQQAPSM